MGAFVEYSQGKKEVWYSINKKYGQFLSNESSDTFLIGLLVLAMKQNEDIYIEGKVSEKLFYNLTNYLVKILTLLIPSLHQIKIFPQELTQENLVKPIQGVATGFSGGIDSFCTFIDHFQENTPTSYKITHLLLNNVGSHGEGGQQLFEKRYQRLYMFAQEYELPFISINSNLHEILPRNFQTTHTTRNISAILLLPKLFTKYYYSSAHKYEDCIIKESPDGAVIDPAAIHLLSTENTECISAGCQYSRVEKTLKVSEFEPSYRYLDVCVNAVEDAENCSQCWKCARTLLTLEILGKHELYDRVFNLDKYYEIKTSYIQSLRDSSSPLTKEVIELALSRGYDLNFTTG
ncbi:MAG: hypothetical protein Cpurp_07730 [Chlorogloea purpurea SAG 13.99]|nr:hypothetical protein [Chlorogloea purpurea SAG 13.99]